MIQNSVIMKSGGSEGVAPACGTFKLTDENSYPATIPIENANQYSHLIVAALDINDDIDMYISYGIYPLVFYSTDEVLSPLSQFYNGTVVNKSSGKIKIESASGFSLAGASPVFNDNNIIVNTPDTKPFALGTYMYVAW